MACVCIQAHVETGDEAEIVPGSGNILRGQHADPRDAGKVDTPSWCPELGEVAHARLSGC